MQIFVKYTNLFLFDMLIKLVLIVNDRAVKSFQRQTRMRQTSQNVLESWLTKSRNSTCRSVLDILETATIIKISEKKVNKKCAFIKKDK